MSPPTATARISPTAGGTLLIDEHDGDWKETPSAPMIEAPGVRVSVQVQGDDPRDLSVPLDAVTIVGSSASCGVRVPGAPEQAALARSDDGLFFVTKMADVALSLGPVAVGDYGVPVTERAQQLRLPEATLDLSSMVVQGSAQHLRCPGLRPLPLLRA